jgi:hypothetical protein
LNIVCNIWIRIRKIPVPGRIKMPRTQKEKKMGRWEDEKMEIEKMRG